VEGLFVVATKPGFLIGPGAAVGVGIEIARPVRNREVTVSHPLYDGMQDTERRERPMARLALPAMGWMFCALED